MNVYPLYGLIYYFPATLPPEPLPPTIHSLSWFIGIHFSHSFSHYIAPLPVQPLCYPLLPSTNEMFFVLQTAFLFGHTENLFLIGSLRKEKPQKL
jgi:hypothetical protein